MDVVPVVSERIQAAEARLQPIQIVGKILRKCAANDHVAVQHGVDIADGESQIVQIRLPSVLIGGIAGGKTGEKILQRDVQLQTRPPG